ncbi:MAG: class Ib ribonucleoside-diphosphate reductase assembly flavoprotein NrdI [Arsenophonus sp. ET-YP4-MAG3]
MKTQSLIYYSSKSENCHRFVQKLRISATRIPIDINKIATNATQPYVLLVPTYCGGSKIGAVPKPVIHFLNQQKNRNFLRGVIASGNSNFYKTYAIAGNIISAKCQVPLLYRFELLGTEWDLQQVRQRLEKFWQQQMKQSNTELSYDNTAS